MLYIRFTEDLPSVFQRFEIALEAENVRQAEEVLKRAAGAEDVSFLFIDILDDRSRYDTQISIDNTTYYAFTSWLDSYK